MGSDTAEGDSRWRRRGYGDSDPEEAGERKRSREQSDDKYSRRNRSQERDHRRRSRTPDSRRRRSRSRDTDMRKERDRERDRGKGRERDSDRRRRREQTEDSESGHRHRRRHRSPEDDSSRRHSRRGHREENGADDADADRSVVRRRRGPLASQADSFAVSTGEEPEKPKEKPNFGNTGLLAAASNAVATADGTTITLKYHEPPEARKPPPRDEWRLFAFKGQDIIDTIELSKRSCWLIGREMAVVDLPAEHPSISKQHAVIQFRYTEKRNEFGDKIGRVKPYLIDLESANGTKLNNDKVPDSRYLELRDKDVIQFGLSTREYVLMLAPKQ
ncbi:SMAD/FHA domain-containing protein [Diplogelasinospora grovesii]|uniref:SMAD/FHA domain-containing protein n=1 Tax=Diplogelasinospora grovesii TaxID=303347 RepID=A0AAN6NBN5_9PEZI|nr:SMAD/FHA domain-containing protein [Diplogelasinospora grovesii]